MELTQPLERNPGEHVLQTNQAKGREISLRTLAYKAAEVAQEAWGLF